MGFDRAWWSGLFTLVVACWWIVFVIEVSYPKSGWVGVALNAGLLALLIGHIWSTPPNKDVEE